MNYLAIDTSGDLLVIVSANGKKTVRNLTGCQTKHSLTLMPYIEEAMEELGVSLNDLDFFAVVVGPGSFTGIRIGVATVKALCLATGKKALVVTSFDLLAYSNNAPEKCVCLVDANHGNYYFTAYENKSMVYQPAFMTKEEICSKFADFTPVSLKEGPIDGAIIVDAVSGMENAIEAKCDNLIDYNAVQPLYVKRSQAEEESC